MARAIDREEVLYQLERLRLEAMLNDECEEETIKRCISAVKLVPTLTPPNEPERAGLYGKYTVYKNKDNSLVTDCFVLRPAKDPAAVIALRAYAAVTDTTELAADIINWVGAEPNEPLMLDELREMDGEPVWIANPDALGYGRWGIVDGVYQAEDDQVLMLRGDYSCHYYGKTWLAYRRPKEEQ